MIIGFDLDDILFDFMTPFHSYNNKRYSTSYERPQYRKDLAKMWGVSEEEEVKRVFDFYQSPEHWNALPMAGAVEGVKNLRQKHNLFIITSKPENLKDKTLEWLDKHFPQMFDGVHFTNQYHGNGLRRTKGDVCRGLGVKFFVDDFLHNVEDVASSGVPALLLDAPWNQGEVKPPVTRVYSWEEIVKVLSSQK